jgi:hypothetical protein
MLLPHLQESPSILALASEHCQVLLRSLFPPPCALFPPPPSALAAILACRVSSRQLLTHLSTCPSLFSPAYSPLSPLFPLALPLSRLEKDAESKESQFPSEISRDSTRACRGALQIHPQICLFRSAPLSGLCLDEA